MLPCAADHSLQMELNISVCSPSSQHMYEADFPAAENVKDPLLSPTCSSVCSINSPMETLEFDLKPQFEQSKDLFPCLSQGNDFPWNVAPMCGDDPHMGNTGYELNMEDIILCEELDLSQGPTLAQLNSSDSVSPFDDLGDVNEICKATPRMPLSTVSTVPQGSSTLYNLTKDAGKNSAASTPRESTQRVTSDDKRVAGNDAAYSQQLETPGKQPSASDNSKATGGSSCLQELLMKKEVIEQPVKKAPVLPSNEPEPAAGKQNLKRPVSPDSDTNGSSGSLDKKWEDIKHFIHEEEQAANGGPVLKKIKTEPEDIAFTPQDDLAESIKEEPFESDGDDGSATENEDDMDNSDAESEDSQNSFLDEFVGSGKKDRRYFWQYNTQAKGPKGKRLCKTVDADDPHVLNDFEDPVFDPEQNQMRYKHNGKARRGDGNDIAPNPTKLFQLGNELNKLNRMITDMLPMTELPNPARSKTRKEKNKFASRACRLKKKAQHEANKLKLYGLEQEHHQLMAVLSDVKGYIRKHLDSRKTGGCNISAKLDLLIRTNLTEMIAGNTTDYVNTVLDKVSGGENDGGLIFD